MMVTERCRQAYVNGAANWMAFHRGPFRNTILSFNMSEEFFREILVPESITNDGCRMILVVFKESLCLIQQCVYGAEPHCVVWIMKEYGVPTSWSRLFRIDLSGGLRRPLGLRENGEVIFATHDGNLVSCDHQSRRITYLGNSNSTEEEEGKLKEAERLGMLNILESPENPVVSGQKKKKNKNKKEEQEKEGARRISYLAVKETRQNINMFIEVARKEEVEEDGFNFQHCTKIVIVSRAFTPFYTDTYAESLVMLYKLESPENAVVSGQKKKKKKNKKKKKEEEKEQEEAGST
ncbi:hypothetical protein RHGRI_017524 [Rhododendron griersonianum]|uniref:F-box associated domain-containing protein n=1 Tax=Rhododendron griersonianum TaxID=479676 RepID=A0AAV6JY89_9ERIC|nr:hypothetical protein RHGRI_017524 [Rhododendron griersonianum]